MKAIILCHQTTSANEDFWKIFIPIVASILSALAGYFIAAYNNKKAIGKSVDEQLDSILKLAVQYPYLEMETFTHAWDKNKILSSNAEEAEKYQRYEIYTTIVFNYMERYCSYHEYVPNRMKDVDIKNWIRTHKEVWLDPINLNENIDGYPEKFRDLMNSYLK